MNFIGQWILLNLITLAFAYPLSKYAFLVLQKKISARIDARVFKFLGLNTANMSWASYLRSLLWFQLLGWLLVYGLAFFQTGAKHYSADMAFQLASSYVTNTNWQVLAGEQFWNLPLRLFGIITQNFFSASTGLCVLLVFARCFKGKNAPLGNFWLDIWRSTIYLLLPLSLVAAFFLTSQGVPQNFKNDLHIAQYDSSQGLSQAIPMGPIASQVSIKLLGNNGGSYTAANSAHPLENPTPCSHVFEMVMMMLLAVMGCFLFARIIGNTRCGWYILLTMFILLSLLTIGAYLTEPTNFLGKELRVGTMGSVMWHAITTGTSTGATSAVIDQFQPLTYGFYLFLMNIGEIAYGGIGMGVVNILFLFILSSFILSLLTGTQPRFLRNHVPISVIKWSMLYIILLPCLTLILLILMMVVWDLLRGATFPEPYMLSAAWYAVSSWFNNNGSGFSAWVPDGQLMNYISGVSMLLGRYIPITIAFVVSGIFAKELQLEAGNGGFDLDTTLFCMVNVFVILIITMLAFLPLWALGPLMAQGLITAL